MAMLNESPAAPLSISSEVSSLHGQNAQAQPHGGPAPTRTCPPGPIPAAPPALVRRDEHGVDWIAFQYSKDRVRTEYCIRCDVESIDLTSLSKSFRKQNCIYPRADVPELSYLGNRHRYENECNRIGWALAQLNPSLRNKRGLIQRAVDSWRNSNADPKVRSRRVRRLSKQNQNRQQQRRLSQVQDRGLVSARSSISSNSSSGSSNSSSSSATSDMAFVMMPTSSDTYGPESHQWPQIMGAGEAKYEDPGNNLRIARTLSASSASSTSSSPPVTLIRALPMTVDTVAFNFATTDAINPLQYPTSLVTPYDCSNPKSPYAPTDNQPDPDSSRHKKSLKYIILDNDPTAATSSRLRVRVTINDVDLEQVPDKYRLDHAVFPRSIIPSLSTHFRHHGAPPSGFEDEDRTKLEQEINEIGIKMAWLQPRLFEDRMQFLQRAIDAYRCKLVHVGGGKTELSVRRGKAKWLARKENRNRPCI
ncbi:hypothetical protein V1517DRAFT_322968 [Lipomyces orientalis]|uniref:Uncharacterized protein n=1 Tax=Lipomyces orientalis TaxID=1233043 RepID=A0ACC3TP07_9ASCO